LSSLKTLKIRRILTVALAIAVLSLLSVRKAAAATRTTGQQVSKSSRSGKVHRAKSRSRRRGSWKKRGQKDIDAKRATDIQEALIREKYLDGEPNGKWDDRTKTAMQKYQQDNGWQTKVLPDSRAIIKLGLGPSNEGLINPDTAATAMSTDPAIPAEKNPSEAVGRSGSSH
jgi:peptidoglycan hydrolase-like protein with peptidoglycan-binding domain